MPSSLHRLGLHGILFCNHHQCTWSCDKEIFVDLSSCIFPQCKYLLEYDLSSTKHWLHFDCGIWFSVSLKNGNIQQNGTSIFTWQKVLSNKIFNLKQFPFYIVANSCKWLSRGVTCSLVHHPVLSLPKILGLLSLCFLWFLSPPTWSSPSFYLSDLRRS